MGAAGTVRSRGHGARPLKRRPLAGSAERACAWLAGVAGIALALACPSTSETGPEAPDPEVEETSPGDDGQRPDAPGQGFPAESDAEGAPDGDEAPGDGRDPEPGEGAPGEDAIDDDDSDAMDEGAARDDEPPRPPGADLSRDEARARASERVGQAEEALRGEATDTETAIARAREALVYDQGNLRAMLILAWSHYKRGNYDLAEEVLIQAADRADGEDHPRYHFIAGLIYDTTERASRAQRAYERAVDLEPRYASALLNLGVHYLENRRYPEAIRVYERLTGELGDNRPASWTNLGSAYRGRAADLEGPTGDAEARREYLRDAEEAYRRALHIDSDYAPAHYNLGLLYLDADPFPDNGGDLENLARLRRAEHYLDNYRDMADTDDARVEEHAQVVQNQIEREERRIERRERREERERERERRQQGGDP